MYTTTRIWIALIAIVSLCSISCKKFLASYSQNNSFVESAKDLNEILIGDAYYDFYTPTPEMMYAMDDDIDVGKPSSNFNYPQDVGFRYWQAQPRMNSEGKLTYSDKYFNNLYSRIARINTILHNVPLLRSKGEPASTLDRIAGEAHFLRAYYYFMLVNVYGKPYRPATATFDFGVPLKTDPTIKDQFSSRSTTQQVYDQIIDDLLQAEKELSGFHQNSTVRANQASAQALLCKVYLFMENYEQAVLYADKVINLNKYHLTDLNTHPAGTDFLDKNSAEVIFTMGSNQIPSIMVIHMDIPTTPHFIPSNELTLSYEPKDLRLQAFFIRNSKGQMKVAKKRKNANSTIDDVSDMFLLRLSEVYLNKAEALAVMDQFEAARSTLVELRKKRFKPVDLPSISSEGETLINDIRNERRLELCMEAHRWFDLRRYGVHSKYPFSKIIRHRSIVYANNGYIDNGYYELNPYDEDAAAYVIPIANDEIEFNQGMLLNESRPERMLKQ